MIAMKKLSLLLLFILFVGVGFSQTDKEFWFVAPEVSSTHADKPIFLRMSTTGLTSTVTVSQPANPAFTPIVVTIPPNTTTSVDLTTWLTQIESGAPLSDTVENKGLHITATENITVYYEILGTLAPNVLNSDIFVLKGRNALGRRFYTPFQNKLPNADNLYAGAYTGRSAFDIVATENNTTITITPTQAVVGASGIAHPAGIPYTIVLNRGQTYSGQATGPNPGDHLSGTLIVADKPIAVTIKDDSVRQNWALDLMGDQLVPVNILGTDYIVIRGELKERNDTNLFHNTNYNPDFGDRAVICATEDATIVSIGGVTVATLNAGETYNHQVPINATAEYIQTSKKVYVFHVSGFGDEMGGALLPPIICTGSRQVSVFRDTDEPFYLNILVRDGGQNNFSITNSSTGIAPSIPGGAFTKVPGTPVGMGDWYSAKILFTPATVPSSTSCLISNSSTDFHLGIINGQAVDAGCRYGYFSNYAGLNGGNASATSSTICYNSSTSIVLTGSAGSIQWQQSPNGTTGWTNVSGGSGANSSTYVTPNLTSTTYYRAVLSNGTCADQFSTDATVFIDPTTIGGNVNSSDTVCSGSNSGTLTLAGHTGIIQKWESSLDNFATPGTPIANTSTTFNYSNITVTTWYRAVVKSGSCSSQNSSSAKLTIDPVSVGGTVNSNSTVCAGSSGTLTLAGHTGTIEKWESSLDNFATPGTPIINTSTTLNYTNITVSTWYRAVVISGSCSSENSATAKITVDPVTASGNLSANATVCSGANSGTLTLTGYNGTIIKWESSIDNFITPVDLGNTVNTYTYSNLTQSIKYRVLVQSGICAAQNSDTVLITVGNSSVAGTVNKDTSVCMGANSGVLTLTGYTGNILRWESSPDNFLTITSIPNTTNTHNYFNISETTTFRAFVQAGSCVADTSLTAKITLAPLSEGGLLSSDATVCAGVNSGTLTLSAFTGNIIGWESSIDNFNTIVPIANTVATYNYSNLSKTTAFRVRVKSGNCSEDTSSIVTITVGPGTVSGTVLNDTSVCSGVNSGVLTLSGHTGNIIGWERSTDHFSTPGTAISNTTTTQNYLNLTQTTQYRAIVQYGSCPNSKSAEANIKVDLHSVAGILHSDTTVCPGTNSGSVSLSGYTGNIMEWKSSTDNFINSTVLPSTVYSLAFLNLTKTTKIRAIVKSGNCPSDSITVTITVNPPFSIDLGADTTLCFIKNEKWIKAVADTFSNVLWSTGSVNSFVGIDAPGDIWIKVSNQFSCTASDTIHLGEFCKKTKLCFPDVITPNTDNLNDNFVPCSNGKPITDDTYPAIIANILFIDFEVYDRWGIKLFQSRGVLPTWDGTYQGNSVPAGTYFWIVSYTDSSKEIYEQSGYVTVITNQ